MHDSRDDPAFPTTYSSHRPGLTLRQFAALTLRVPDSGLPWMDEMIVRVTEQYRLLGYFMRVNGRRSRGNEARDGDAMNMPRVFNKHKDTDIPKGAVFIGRPSKWGNPFLIGRDGSRTGVIDKYRHWLVMQPALYAAVKRELAGRDLICFCSPLPCHGDVLLEIANE